MIHINKFSGNCEAHVRQVHSLLGNRGKELILFADTAKEIDGQHEKFQSGALETIDT